MLKNYFTFSRFTLFVALCISAIAAWYSVLGLTAIFAGAVLPIIIMGSILEIAKITTTVWLHRYWNLAPKIIKFYLTAAVIALACLTSMGIFGLLSKAHLDQGLTSGDVGAQVALIDEKIKTQRDNIDLARKALGQMDAQVDQRLARGDSEAGAERAVQIRRSQAAERNRLQAEISTAQKEIAKLNEQRAPIATQLRKVEAEVGPVKYIAALIYGDNPDISMLERAVRWVIILIVVVFDPLAIVLILAANKSLVWEREGEVKVDTLSPAKTTPAPADQISSIDSGQDNIDALNGYSGSQPVMGPENLVSGNITPVMGNNNIEKDVEVVDNTVIDNTVALNESAAATDLPQPSVEVVEVDSQLEVVDDSKDPVVEDIKVEAPVSEPIITDGVTKQANIFSMNDEYAILDGKKISTSALKELHPEFVTKDPITNDILFGTKFPAIAKVGDIYTRVDVTPHKTYKFNGVKWIQLNREGNNTYLQNTAYLQYLISKLDKGEYDPEFLTEYEQEEISNYLKGTT